MRKEAFSLDHIKLSTVLASHSHYMASSLLIAIPDCLVDFCKCSNINQMAAGLKLCRCSHGIFNPFF